MEKIHSLNEPMCYYIIFVLSENTFHTALQNDPSKMKCSVLNLVITDRWICHHLKFQQKLQQEQCILTGDKN